MKAEVICQGKIQVKVQGSCKKTVRHLWWMVFRMAASREVRGRGGTGIGCMEEEHLWF